jgi:anthranilate synthase/aminodeoxychorismate synthase-like glutamine amidotransferase
MILVIDNYDSFTYNLVQLLGWLGADVLVRRNDAISLDEIDRLQPSHIVISPGPCTPLEAGISVGVVRSFGRRIPILGVCLGHQAIGLAYGASIVRAPTPVHGKVHPIFHDGDSLFYGLPNPFPATRYHSLVVSEGDLPSCLKVTARTEDGLVMALRHRYHPVVGVQFHPESIATHGGRRILANFLGSGLPNGG